MRNGRRRRLRLILLLGVGIGAATVALAAYAGNLLRQPELDTVDARFELRGAQPPPKDVVVVGIDDATFQDLGERWPFRRIRHAELIERLRRAGVRAIAYDVQFTEPSESPADDDALIEAARRAGNAVFGTTEVDERGRARVFGGDEALRYARARAADASLKPDSGGVYRRLAYSLQGLPSFAAVTAGAGRDEFPDDEVWIDFHGGPGAVQQVSFSRVLSGRVDSRLLRDRIAVVGAVAPSLQDVHATSTTGDELMSGPEIQANAISTVLRDFPLNDSPDLFDVALIALLAMVAPILSFRLPPLPALLLALAGGGAYAVVAYLAFEAGSILPVVYPLLALALAIVGSLAVHYVTTAYERERVRELLTRFVPDRVAEQLMAREDGTRLGGVEAECTVLFSDLRGFTAYSESQPPGRVIEVLNRYHGEMCDAVLGNGGTLVSYMGDGIMAVFGAPIEQEDHADRALAAAREMMGERLRRFNDWMRSEGHGEGFRMGIGLNSGPVLAGNIGSERRLEYTTIGDTVNTASRLEGMTKGTPHQLFLSDTTRERLVREHPDLAFVDELEVRGRQATVRVWSLDGRAPRP